VKESVAVIVITAILGVVIALIDLAVEFGIGLII
jgi:preprotein translocase subunit SecE